ncbi:MAG: hypothetical protein JOY87_07570 [Candidatus Eremiobacteraeota bacterium]|nr:hypothetical protein [Candidatus Eremiobacteraeota bacterium]MBV8338598.1 hypothetical protein [Candidatus Eremiobacteraeota bacterium]MBV8460640.1 hypothetical protein [Candidatus Eremiobacteraeota bacterium]MBV8594743.1 hypothetical protein [Candidatus Eremiobacteraeota bacterium]MBV8668986.1 hypothetical protein [Candidatus Eremiobacteraeota bacterium]
MSSGLVMSLSSDARFVTVVVAVLFLIAVELGFRWGKRGAASGHDQPLGTTIGAAFGVVGLLLAFSFSLSVTRFDSRRADLVDEANAIGKTITTTQLLDASTRPRMLAELKEYVETRIAFAYAGGDAEARAPFTRRSGELQHAMWQLVTQDARKDPHSTMTPLFIQALNETMDTAEKHNAALAAVIPLPIVAVLLIIVLVSGVLLGIDFGRKGRRSPVVQLLFAVMLGLVIGVILDMDRPQHGLIRIDVSPLESLRSLLNAQT